jgi:dUTP pyrophosphatase
MERMKLKVQKLPHFLGELPKYETSHASGIDLRAQVRQPIQIAPGERVLIPTGLAVEIPLGFEIQIRPRSGLAAKQGVTVLNSPGTVDADYRGEIKIILINLGKEIVTVNDQDRVAQMVLAPVFQAELVLTENLSSTTRGAGGFGSTGVVERT